MSAARKRWDVQSKGCAGRDGAPSQPSKQEVARLEVDRAGKPDRSIDKAVTGCDVYVGEAVGMADLDLARIAIDDRARITGDKATPIVREAVDEFFPRSVL